MGPAQTSHARRRKGLPFVALLAVAAGSAGLGAVRARADTQVTTYVVKTQEDRDSTRWTLTEWLRIKERIRMMDLWLALFSDPKKDRFQPELMLSYGVTRGRYAYDGTAGSGTGSLSGNTGRAQLWLTNLVSSTVGVRTLNLDLGGEYYRRQTGSFVAADAAAATTVAAASETPTGARQLQNDYYSGDLRLFGRNIQDSSLVLKYGRYTARNAIVGGLPGEADPASGDGSGKAQGAMAGAELQLYVFRWLGAEGNYVKYGDARRPDAATATSGAYFDYMAYIEISLLRIMGGIYQEDWDLTRQGSPLKTREKGSIGAVKLQF